METVNHKLVEIALVHVEGTPFEQFFHAFCPPLIGNEFVPLGGVHDGGADAFLATKGIYEGKGVNPDTFYQASIQEDHRSKIRKTIKRLKDFGREPKTLYYVTSRVVVGIDKDEEALTAELKVFIKIRDRKWIVTNINHSPATISAFKTYLQPSLAFLSEVGGATIINESQNIPARTMCVFLGQEIERQRGKTDLLEAITDSLIFWALEGTDPDKNIFLKRHEILKKIELTLPSALPFINKILETRLERLASKQAASGREIKWHKKEDKFCLPFETRKLIIEENTEDEFLKLKVLELFAKRADQYQKSDEDSINSDQIAELAHRTIERTFEKEGLELAYFLSGKNDAKSYFSIADSVDDAMLEMELNGIDAINAKDAALAVLRQAFYNSSEEERRYFGKLSRTFTLLFTLRNEPRVIEHFKCMSSNFVLFVGSDIIIRALSERYLAKEDQMTVNLLRIIRDAGSNLVLTEGFLDEVHTHLEGTDWEFQNYFADLEKNFDRNIVRHAPKILIRSYFYAKLDSLLGNRPSSWSSYIHQFCNYTDLHSNKGKNQIRGYLQEKFGFEFYSHEDMANLVNQDEVELLAEKIRPIKKGNILAINDARQILAVYNKRASLGEEHSPNSYGYRTWWFTHETRVRQYTRDLVDAKGAQYIMRPEFILNFIALSPSTEAVRNSYRTIFPTILGVRLSNRMREDIFHNVMGKVKEVQKVDESRARVMMGEMSNRLMGDMYKQYETELGSVQKENE